MHGLMFGGFSSSTFKRPLAKNAISDMEDEFKRPSGQLSNRPVVNKFLLKEKDKLVVPDYYRSFGNHRIATHLRRQGWDIECLDYFYMFSEDELQQYVDDRITKDTVFIGISIIFSLEKSSSVGIISLMNYIRKKYPWVKFIAGGVKSYCITFLPNADYYIAGNGEYAIDATLKYIMGQGEKPKTKVVKSTGLEIIDAVRDYPCYPKRNASISYEERDFIQPYETLNIELARGCRFKCKYCTYPLVGLKGNMRRDEDSVYEELLENYERWGVWNYYFTDDTVNDSKEKMKMISDVVDRLPFQPQFNGYARADLLIRHGKETWNHMINSGFTSHSYGIESFNHASAKVMGKGMPPEEMKDGILEVEDYFNERSPYFYTGSLTMIAGLPHETFETLDKSKEWLNKYWHNHWITYSSLVIFRNDKDTIDEIDGNIFDDFTNYGYRFERFPTILDKDLISQHRDNIKKGELTNNNKPLFWNYWIHPSGKYDMIDMDDWVKDFLDERYELGCNAVSSFGGSSVVMKEYESPQNMKDYYKVNSKSNTLNSVEILTQFVNQYKREKLSYKYGVL